MLLASEAPAELVLPLVDTAWASFVPREDRPEEFDQQQSYINARDLVSFCLGGNAAGKTACSAKKCGDFVLNTPPPRPNTPFWIVGATYKQVCAVCWSEKLWGQQFIPHCEFDLTRASWINAKMRWPATVPLKPWPNGNNWALEFMSYEQGRTAMQARSIGGFWFSEMFPWSLFLEVLRGCREYMFPGGQFCEFTPLDPELCVAIERVMDDPPPGWAFYRLNTERNRENLAADWYEQFFAAVPDEMLATRKTGALATFEGVIYQSFNPAVHVVNDDAAVFLPGMSHYRAFDWGASADHPMAGVWAAQDGIGDTIIYDEYWDISQQKITQDHAGEFLARSIAWGWPEPEFFNEPGPNRTHYVRSVRKRVAELRAAMNGHASGLKDTGYRYYGESFADPSRPGELNAFNYWGISTFPASNDVMKGIDLVRSRLKVNPITGRPRLFIHARCKHLIEEMRKYRWVRRANDSLTIQAAARPVPLKKGDDVADCLRYVLMSVERTRGATPTSTSSARIENRQDVFLDRGGDRVSSRQTATSGWFRK